jgi:hypothetical protein
MLSVYQLISWTTHKTSRMAIIAALLVSLGTSSNAADPISAQDKVLLPVRVATLHGDGAQLDGTLIQNWDKIETFVSWRVKLGAGELEIVVRQASGSASVGNSYQIEIAEKKLSGTVKDTGGWRMVEDVSGVRSDIAATEEKRTICHELGGNNATRSGGQKF